MVELTQGGNASIAGAQVSVTVEWSPSRIQGSEVDVSAFLLEASGKVRNDQDFVFYGATSSPCGSVRLTGSAASTRFEVNLSRVPADVEKIAFTATLTGGARFGDAQSLVLSVPGVARFPVRTTGMSEAAVIVGELYKRNGAWKVRAVGQGFNGGLGPLATHFGVDISDDPAPAPAPVSTPARASAPVAAPAPKLTLSKVTLEKSGQSAKISLDKGSREIVINLNWPQRAGEAIDIDLGVFYELRSGRKMVIDGLQFSRNRGGPRDRETNQGCFTSAPWIWHMGDDRSGAVSTGENIYVNPDGASELRRIIVYAFIYQGAARWSTTSAVVTVKVPNQEIAIEMGRQTDARTFCALAELTFTGGSEISVKKLVTFHGGHSDCDKAYGWGMRWNAGSK